MSSEDCNLRLDGNQPDFLRCGVRAKAPSMRGFNPPDGVSSLFHVSGIGHRSWPIPPRPQRKYALSFRELPFNKINFPGEKNKSFNEQPDFDWTVSDSVSSLHLPVHWCWFRSLGDEPPRISLSQSTPILGSLSDHPQPRVPDNGPF